MNHRQNERNHLSFTKKNLVSEKTSENPQMLFVRKFSENIQDM